MKKLLIGIFAVVVVLIILGYSLLFTNFGNNLLKPMIASKISKAIGNKVVVDEFRLRLSTFRIKLRDLQGSNISSGGKFNIFSQGISAKFKSNIVKNDVFKLHGLIIRGGFDVDGSLEGSLNDRIKIKGVSNVAASDTNFNIVLKDSKPRAIYVNAKHINLEKLLLMLNRPVYAKGLIDVVATIDKIKKKSIDGHVDSMLYKGVINTAAIKRLYNIDIPNNTQVHLKTVSDIENSIAYTNFLLKTSLGDLFGKRAVFDLNKFALESDYNINIPDLNKLYFAIKRHMSGNFKANGNIKYKKHDIIANLHSNIWGGVLNAVFKNGDIKGRAQNIEIEDAIEMFLYKKIFASKGNVDFRYNILTKKGNIDAVFNNGHILPNRLSFVIRNAARFDLTKEIYKTTTIKSRIDKKKFTLDLDMASRFTNLSTKKAILDFDKNTIDALMRVVIKKRNIAVTLKGDMNKPSIKIDMKKTLEKNIKNEVKGFIKGLLN
jgi:hypothetical protein